MCERESEGERESAGMCVYETDRDLSRYVCDQRGGKHLGQGLNRAQLMGARRHTRNPNFLITFVFLLYAVTSIRMWYCNTILQLYYYYGVVVL